MIISRRLRYRICRKREKNEVEHAWGFNRAEEVLDIVDYLAGLTNYPNLTVSIWLLESGSWVKYVAMKSGSAKKFEHRRIGLGLFFISVKG